jgi:hypothetical protein
MKNTKAIIITTLSILAASTSVMASEEAYIPWTFDDFGSNCELVEPTDSKAGKSVAVLSEIPSDEDVGELGW